MIDSEIIQRLEITKINTYPFFAILHNLKCLNLETRERITHHDSVFGSKVAAFLVNSKVENYCMISS